MSLFKRKQSKEKDADHAQAAAAAAAPGNSPPVSMAPQMSGQARGPYGPGNGSTPPMANGRRMTSNPVQPPPVNSAHSQNNFSSNSLNLRQQQQPPPQQHPEPSGSPAAGPYPTAPRPQSTTPSGPGQPTSYPWSTRPLRLYAPQTSPPSAPPSPFPRYGLSVPAFPSHSGHMLLFGGLVHERVMNDLWSMDVRDCSTMPVKTKGDAPIPRVGHASAIADRIMLVWGGDTKVKQDDAQDEGLYILDLRTQEWTSVPVSRGPIGRYGHAISMHETKFYVFGGQADGAFMNDLWSYDIKQLALGGTHKWEQVQYTSPAPPRRTGHILVSHQGKLIMFGGTDGNYHYNDTWSFDIATGEWTELSCIGYIPVPREGHAAAIVDDVVYIFGGRDVNGKDLGDLAAFRITNQRWYMFQNMGPAPTARSGHAMVAAHGKIFVIGGEANATSAQQRDDPSQIHVLDTIKIKYPPDNQPPRQIKPRPSDVTQTSVPNASPPKPSHPSDTPQSSLNGLPTSNSIDSLARAASPQTSSPQISQLASNGPALAAPLEPKSFPRSDSGDQLASRSLPNGGPPQRPRREGDEEYRRAMSPPNGPSSPRDGSFPRVSSPTGPGPHSPPQMSKNGFNASILGTRSPSPRMRLSEGGERQAPPPDAFYYGRSPTSNGFGGRPGSVSGAQELLRELKTKEADMDAGRKREAALKVIIGKAMQQGFVLTEGEDEKVDVPEEKEGDEGDATMIRKLRDALLRLKQEKATIQNDLVSQMRLASEKANEAERMRKGALQEAAFFRAKVATLEGNAPTDLARIEKERINELERQLAALAGEHDSNHKDLEKAAEEAKRHRDMASQASEREAETLKRAEEAEEAHREVVAQLEEVVSRASLAESSLREHTEKLIAMSSVAQQREAERDRLQAQLEEVSGGREEHVTLIAQAQGAIVAAGVRTKELEGLHEKASGRVRELEEELAEVKGELEARTRDAEHAAERLAEVENAYAKSREEADGLRTLTTGRLGELVDVNKKRGGEDSALVRGHQDQIRALEEEGKSLRKLLREAGQRVDGAEQGVSHHRQKATELEMAHQKLKGEMRAIRTKLLGAQQELAKYRDLQAAREVELRERDGAVAEIETRCTVLRNLLADHGIAVNDNDLANAGTSSTRELETQLRERTRAHETSQREVEELTRRCNEAEDKVESLGRLVERMKDARSPTAFSARSPTPPGDGDRRTADAERKMAELENQHREKIALLEGDYQTAVKYVKSTERMLKRMKDELNKQKAANTSLQSEIDSMRGRTSTEPGARTRDASGRSTPSFNESELTRRLDKLQGHHNALQQELAASRDVLSAREREVEVLRMRCEEAEREVEVLREDLQQAQQRISTLLDMGQLGGSDDEDDTEMGGMVRSGSAGSSEEASMAFDKFTKELKQWERSRSPGAAGMNGESEDEAAGFHVPPSAGGGGGMTLGKEVAGQHRRHSSEYSADWAR